MNATCHPWMGVLFVSSCLAEYSVLIAQIRIIAYKDGIQWKNEESSCKLLMIRCADVAELADALDSKSSGREAVWVRPPPSAPSRGKVC